MKCNRRARHSRVASLALRRRQNHIKCKKKKADNRPPFGSILLILCNALGVEIAPTESCETMAEKFSTVRRLTDSQPSSSYAMTSTFLMDAAFAAPAPPMATI